MFFLFWLFLENGRKLLFIKNEGRLLTMGGMGIFVVVL